MCNNFEMLGLPTVLPTVQETSRPELPCLPRKGCNDEISIAHCRGLRICRTRRHLGGHEDAVGLEGDLLDLVGLQGGLRLGDEGLLRAGPTEEPGSRRDQRGHEDEAPPQPSPTGSSRELALGHLGHLVTG